MIYAKTDSTVKNREYAFAKTFESVFDEDTFFNSCLQESAWRYEDQQKSSHYLHECFSHSNLLKIEFCQAKEANFYPYPGVWGRKQELTLNSTVQGGAKEMSPV